MTSYSEQLKFIKRLKIKEGETRRLNCPFCNGYNTLSISLINGTLEWNCFKASCDVHGVNDEGHTIEGIKHKLFYNKNDAQEKSSFGKEIPEYLVPIDNNESVLAYLSSVNSLQAYKDKLVDIKYAPSENRVMFSINGKGYIGRRLGLYGPKWVKYGDVSELFTCGMGKIGVLVEDAPSACAVGVVSGYTGISLLGTQLTSTNKHKLVTQYTTIIICLDPDAAKKSITLSSKLSGLIQTRVVLIPDDLKYFQPDKIKEILK